MDQSLPRVAVLDAKGRAVALPSEPVHLPGQTIAIPEGYQVVSPDRARKVGMLGALAGILGIQQRGYRPVEPAPSKRSGTRRRARRAARQRAHESRRLNRTKNRRRSQSAKRQK